MRRVAACPMALDCVPAGLRVLRLPLGQEAGLDEGWRQEILGPRLRPWPMPAPSIRCRSIDVGAGNVAKSRSTSWARGQHGASWHCSRKKWNCFVSYLGTSVELECDLRRFGDAKPDIFQAPWSLGGEFNISKSPYHPLLTEGAISLVGILWVEGSEESPNRSPHHSLCALTVEILWLDFTFSS